MKRYILVAWLWLLPWISTAQSLIMVGVGHLVGETGLICQLQKQGYTVEPVLP